MVKYQNQVVVCKYEKGFMQIALCTRRRGRKGHPPNLPKSALLSFVDKEQSLKSHHFLKVRQRKIEMSHSNGCQPETAHNRSDSNDYHL